MNLVSASFVIWLHYEHLLTSPGPISVRNDISGPYSSSFICIHKNLHFKTKFDIFFNEYLGLSLNTVEMSRKRNFCFTFYCVRDSDKLSADSFLTVVVRTQLSLCYPSLGALWTSHGNEQDFACEISLSGCFWIYSIVFTYVQASYIGTFACV